jgi:hypothetical protein
MFIDWLMAVEALRQLDKAVVCMAEQCVYEYFKPQVILLSH